eukprot:3941773-Rhodomonas_salina.1
MFLTAAVPVPVYPVNCRTSAVPGYPWYPGMCISGWGETAFAGSAQVPGYRLWELGPKLIHNFTVGRAMLVERLAMGVRQA